jgi:hypothetical protein
MMLPDSFAIPRVPAVRTLSVSTEGCQTGPTAAALLLLKTLHVLFNSRILVAGYFYPRGSLFCDALRQTAAWDRGPTSTVPNLF